MSENNHISPALENYLKAIYVLQRVHDVVKVIDISKFLHVTMPSVTGSMKRLAELDYIKYQKRRHVQLTAEGEKIARAVTRRHEELYTFYREILGADQTAANESACEVEHVLDPQILERTIRLTSWLKSLPDDLQKEFRREVQSIGGSPGNGRQPRFLNEVGLGTKAIVAKVLAEGEIGRRMLDMGVTKGSEIEIVRVAPFGDPIEVKIKGYYLSLRKSEAAKIEVMQ